VPRTQSSPRTEGVNRYPVSSLSHLKIAFSVLLGGAGAFPPGRGGRLIPLLKRGIRSFYCMYKHRPTHEKREEKKTKEKKENFVVDYDWEGKAKNAWWCLFTREDEGIHPSESCEREDNQTRRICKIATTYIPRYLCT